jgi:hypothetical protein
MQGNDSVRCFVLGNNSVRCFVFARVQAAYIMWAYGRLERPQPIDLHNQSIVIFFIVHFVLYRSSLPCPSSPRVWIIFAVLRWKTVGSPPRKRGDLCCFARKASVRRHESTTAILVLRGSFACQHNWWLRRGRSIERSPARSCYVKGVIKKLQSTTVTWILNLLL